MPMRGVEIGMAEDSRTGSTNSMGQASDKSPHRVGLADGELLVQLEARMQP